ncbi:MAG: hypothetical protein IPH18_17570 [Chitinophagaceae bacterium]|nr:hypothetical protein [Chitinophagaceae bacterium]MBK8953563.1 hypothetical protein [Chitinophagaceae bacterium]
MKRLLLIMFFITLVTTTGRTQDRIYRQNGKTIEAKVLEVSSSEVKYKEFNNPDGPVYVLEADRIKKIVFENGTVQTFSDNLRDSERYSDDRSTAVKLNFLSPLYGYTEFGFEKSKGVGKSIEFSIGIIGAGKSATLDYYTNQLREVKRGQFGFFVSGGYKFGKLPDFIIFGKTKASHLMQGTYIKPVAYVGHYKENVIVEKGNNTMEVGKQNVTFGALQLELGRQWVFGEKFLLDVYWGIGYGFDNKKDSYQGIYDTWNDNASAYNYANARAGKSPGFSGTYGIKLGWLIK